MKYFMTCKDDGSNKFWYMKVDGISFTVTFGETGTTGETYTKSYESEEACLKEVKRKLLRLKKNGYVEGDATLADTKSATLKQNPEPSNDYLKAWEEICNAKNLQLALIDHFSYLERVSKLSIKEIENNNSAREVKRSHIIFRFSL
ncbi:WGR domain-containing protein, partial [Leptospira santarosai]